VVPRRLEPGNAPERRFFLDPSPLDGRPELAAGEAEHALRVLRLQPGDRFIGLDGRGRSWPCRVSSVEKKRARIECSGEPCVEARAGTPGSDLAWIEIALVLPRGGRAEEIVDALTQLGAAAISPLAAERAQPEARHVSPARAERWTRVAQEACKQSGRLWLPVISAVRPLTEWIESRSESDVLVLAPDAAVPLSAALERRIAAAGADWTEAAPLSLVVGPEGGFSPAEEELCAARGAQRVRLGPHVLRIETAAAAALAIAAERLFRARRS
jgi:16S rRNA (uracil1498-N3)-methyltransferase